MTQITLDLCALHETIVTDRGVRWARKLTRQAREHLQQVAQFPIETRDCRLYRCW